MLTILLIWLDYPSVDQQLSTKKRSKRAWRMPATSHQSNRSNCSLVVFLIRYAQMSSSKRPLICSKPCRWQEHMNDVQQH